MQTPQDRAAAFTGTAHSVPTAPPMPRALAPVELAPGPGGLAWTLPPGPGCAGHARRVLAGVLDEAGVARPVIADAQLMASELATNAHQHAPAHGPHELWLYSGPPGEARCAVFDRYVAARLAGYSWTSGDCGRGLSIVHELSEGRWGMLRSVSRRAPRVQGKAVWFALPGEVRLPAHLLQQPFG